VRVADRPGSPGYVLRPKDCIDDCVGHGFRLCPTYVLDFLAAHAEDGATEEDVFPAGEFGVKTGADFEQAGDASVDRHPAGGGFGDAAVDLEPGGFAGAVAADDADAFPLLNLGTDVLERPEFLDLVTLHDLPAGEPVAGFAGGLGVRG